VTVLAGAIGVLFSVAHGARAMSNEPTGFGPVPFGASAATVQKAFPTLQSKGTEQFLSLYELRDQKVLGLKPCLLQLRFVDDQLYEIQFTCEPRARVPAALQKAFGEPTETAPTGTSWLGEKRTVGLNPASGVFVFTDRARGQIAHQKLLRYILSRPAQPAPSPAATPGP